MAKGKNDIILRDRMQFTFSGDDIPTLYGRVDLSDYVSIPKSEGLKIKEIRFQVRDPTVPNSGSFNQLLLNPGATTTSAGAAFLKIYSSVTAYETAQDVGIGSPNVINVVEHQHYITLVQESGQNTGGNQLVSYFEYGVPDLHPDGFPVVTDLLIGVAAENCTKYNNDVLELDIMIVAEKVKLTKDDMELMLTQATDL